GDTDVTATFEGEEDSAEVNVTVPDAEVVDLVVTPDPLAVEVGDSEQLTAIAEFDDETFVDVTEDAAWESDDPDIVSVGDAGLVAGLAEGDTTVTATYEGESDSAEVNVTAPVSPPEDALTLAKSAEPDSFSDVGDEITYTFTVTNTTEDHTIVDVVVTDEMFPDMECGVDELAPGESFNCDEIYVTTQADVDAGEVVNAASTTGEDEGSGEEVGDDDEIIVPGPDMDASLDMEKTVDTEGPVWIGDEITYTLTATNDGNVTIFDVVITDEMFPDMECGPVDLAPGDEALVCTETYTVTDDDAEVGSVSNTASVEGEDPAGDDTEDTDTIEIAVEQVVEE